VTRRRDISPTLDIAPRPGYRALMALVQRLSSWVHGRWIECGARPSVLVNPATEEPLAEASSAGVDFAKVLAHARTVGGPAMRTLSFGERARLLREVAAVLHAGREAFLDVSQANGGNTRGDAKFDVDGAIATLGAYADIGESIARRCGERRFLVDGDAIQLGRSPRFVGQHVWTTRPGVAVHVGAFNFPAWGTFEKAAVAWLAGVPVVTKPATSTSLLTFRMVEALVASGKLPDGALQLVCGATGDLLAQLGPHDHLAFTGSNVTGTALRRTPGFAERGVRVNVEADSLNAAIVGPDLRPGSETWSALIRNVTTDVTQKAGQKCTAVRRVLVPEALIDAVEEALADAFAAVVVGSPSEAGVGMGPVSTEAQLRDVSEGIGRLTSVARVVVGGRDRIDGRGAPAGKGYFVAPTLLRAQQSGGAPLIHELEVFGPCVTLVPYDGSAESAAEIVGRGGGSLVSAAYAEDAAWIERLVLAAAPWLGRLLLVGGKVADQATPPGMVLAPLVHGGPGRAGAGEELGGERGLFFYMQRTALQGDRGLLQRAFGAASP
jgi:oxepin-CoA hydrolase/3-oxo-5,6-dehydrosuberyl-CoA semialdehyde dehydrogenase